MAKAKKSVKKKSRKPITQEPAVKHPDFKGYESFSHTHGPLVMLQVDDLFYKDMSKKNVDWIIFGDEVVSRKEDLDCHFAFSEFNNSPSAWENTPYIRTYSRKMRAIRYEKY